MKNKRGFTLIELLVVMAIIAVLSSILFPVFASAKRSAQDKVCQSNMKQLALATALYTDTFGGNYPMQSQDAVVDWNSPTAADNWAKALEKYIKSAHIPACGISRTRSDCKTNCTMAVGSISYPISYLGNGKIFGNRANESMVKHASKTILFQCGGRTWNKCWLAPAFDAEYEEWNDYTSSSWCNHNEGTNLAFADSHIGWCRYKKLAENVATNKEAKLTMFDL